MFYARPGHMSYSRPATNYLVRFSLASENGHLIIVLILCVFPGSQQYSARVPFFNINFRHFCQDARFMFIFEPVGTNGYLFVVFSVS